MALANSCLSSSLRDFTDRRAITSRNLASSKWRAPIFQLSGMFAQRLFIPHNMVPCPATAVHGADTASTWISPEIARRWWTLSTSSVLQYTSGMLYYLVQHLSYLTMLINQERKNCMAGLSQGSQVWKNTPFGAFFPGAMMVPCEDKGVPWPLALLAAYAER